MDVFEDMMMRARLQQVAAYRELCRRVRRSGRENVFFALLMLFLAYITFQPNVGGGAGLLFLLYVGLALCEFAVGLFKVVHPSAEGLLLDGLVLLLFAGWNIGWQVLAMMAGLQPVLWIVVLGVFMLVQAFARFRDYGTLRRLFAERPTPDLMTWFDELVHEIQRSDPQTDELALDLPTRPPLRAKLLGRTAFFITARGDTAWVAGPNEFRIDREKKDHGTGRRQARLRIAERYYPEFEIADASWENYRKWMAVNAAPEAHP